MAAQRLPFVAALEVAGGALEEVLGFVVAGVLKVRREMPAAIAAERHDAAAFPEDADDVALGNLVVEPLAAHGLPPLLEVF